MTDTIERDLAARLRAVGDLVPDVVKPPADLELRVARRRKRGKRAAGWSALALVACVAVAVAMACLVGGSSDRQRVGVTPEAPAVARLSGAVMLDSRGPWVVALDANGHQMETLVTAHRGMVVDAQLTADHRTLWYLSVAGTAGVDCGDLVRADVESGVSKIVGHAVAFAINADGSRLAISGNGTCAPAPGATLAVRDLATNAQSLAAFGEVASRISWSPLGDRIVANGLTSTMFDVPVQSAGSLEPLDFPLSHLDGFGSDGLYVVNNGSVRRWNVGLDLRVTIGDLDPNIVQIVPTANGLYALSRSRAGGAVDTLTHYEPGHGFVTVRTFATGFGNLTAVP